MLQLECRIKYSSMTVTTLTTADFGLVPLKVVQWRTNAQDLNVKKLLLTPIKNNYAVYNIFKMWGDSFDYILQII